jgi:hypothetical protein
VDPAELTVAVTRGVYHGDRKRQLPSKAQKFAAVKGEETNTAFSHHKKRATIALEHHPGSGYPRP